MKHDLQEDLTTYLEDAHSIEEQSLSQLEKAPEIAGDEAFARALREHLGETEDHESRIRELLEARDAEPSRLKDAVMAAGGKGFVLFARSQTDTPGKLAAHALSYEALEWASYDLLARTAERTGDEEVARTAGSIRDDEQAMMRRIEGLFDRTVAASLEDTVSSELGSHLERYLADAHALEAQSVQLLEAGIGMVGEESALGRVFRRHLDESRGQQDALERRLGALDAQRSILEDAALRIGGLNWGMFFRAQPDTPGKLAAFAYAFEHLEIGGYEQLVRVADRVGDDATVRTVDRILEQERHAAESIRETFENAVTASLAERGRD